MGALLVKLNVMGALCACYSVAFELWVSAKTLNDTGRSPDLPGSFTVDASCGVVPSLVIYSMLCHSWLLPVRQTLTNRRLCRQGVSTAFCVTTGVIVATASMKLLAFYKSGKYNFMAGYEGGGLFGLSAALALTVQVG